MCSVLGLSEEADYSVFFIKTNEKVLVFIVITWRKGVSCTSLCLCGLVVPVVECVGGVCICSSLYSVGGPEVCDVMTQIRVILCWPMSVEHEVPRGRRSVDDYRMGGG